MKNKETMTLEQEKEEVEMEYHYQVGENNHLEIKR